MRRILPIADAAASDDNFKSTVVDDEAAARLAAAQQDSPRAPRRPRPRVYGLHRRQPQHRPIGRYALKTVSASASAPSMRPGSAAFAHGRGQDAASTLTRRPRIARRAVPERGAPRRALASTRKSSTQAPLRRALHRDGAAAGGPASPAAAGRATTDRGGAVVRRVADAPHTPTAKRALATSSPRHIHGRSHARRCSTSASRHVHARSRRRSRASSPARRTTRARADRRPLGRSAATSTHGVVLWRRARVRSSVA